MSARTRVGYGRAAASHGFTLLEVVVALLVLALAVLGAVGIVVIASATLGRADRLERAVALAESVLDSLGAVASPADGAASYGPGEVLWRLEAEGGVTLVATGPEGDTLFTVASVLVP